jgi:hypothetical protein
MSGRYGGLRKATIIIRDDGLLDVVRERETTGESIRGVANLEEAFDAIRAHAWPATQVRGEQRDAKSREK